MKLKIWVIVIFLMSAMAACKKSYLDVSNELAGGLTSTDQIFDNPGYTKRWYANVMSGVPDYSTIIGVGMNGIQNPWTSMTDEVIAGYGDAARYNISAKNSITMGFQRWGTLYPLIRQANIFLEKAKPILATGTDADQLTEAEFKTMKANTLFMRAYYHYLLFEQYGPIPILDRVLAPTDDLDLPRQSVDDVVAFIDKELTNAATLLPQSAITDEQYLANPTKGVALAVKAKLWMYAASPLLNGGYAPALSLVNPDGKKLFPAKDPAKWAKAVNALKEFIDFAEQGNYELYKAYTNGVLDPDKSVYDLFQVYNKEIIWATSKNGFGGMDGDQLDRRSTPRSEPNGLGSTGVLQELVDDFYMKDGLPINNAGFLPASPLYSEAGKSAYNGVNVSNMYINREARFYNTVFFAGRKWHISNKEINFFVGSPNDRSGQYTVSGYMLYKRFNRKVHKTSPGVASVFRPSIVFRLAEFHLLYAEALNEVDPSNALILKYVNLVRERAGIPQLEVLNPSISGNQELQRAAIRRESRVELCTEGQRYFDVRRWMIAENPSGKDKQGGSFYGMNMNGDANTFFQRSVVETRVFETKQYLQPIAYNELEKGKNLVQNPGW
ncbi:RagB/SusD family nutrient uptake outer membrane protein [Pedobacter gandavensis]|uniref:RagB/SusD family nutrient uptake outer membrane protein n=1 Tax=Pedobacter gandavensis TaxID=2679963 RepID=A0ABR6EWS5_9SPHI|nr:RagB/SusD family nutrient uptake outer membrane protein [Pedobacter gandavensis]MBB2149735.1 RagB/SusD family nutrient uptake outer membrane protein [Pedobacter gandavensis]